MTALSLELKGSYELHSTQNLVEPRFAAWVEIDLDALGRNYDRLKSLVGSARQIIVPVKANGYGHGATVIAAFLAERGAYAIQTASVSEAVAIRGSGNPIKIIAYPINLGEDLPTLLQYGIVPTVVDLDGARMVSAMVSRPTAICVKVDAGLRRLGVPLEQAEGIVMKMAEIENIFIEGLYTHVPIADMDHLAWAQDRIRAFEDLTTKLSAQGVTLAVTQARASVHVLGDISDCLTGVCAGHFLYGLRSFPDDGRAKPPSEPILRAIRARLIQVRSILGLSNDSGASPYGSHFQGVERTGVLPIGRANGIPRRLADTAAAVLVAGRPARIISVTLEYTVIDLTSHPCVEVGDIATILGEDGGTSIVIDDVAKCGGCSPLDFVIGLRNIDFRYLQG